MKIETTGIDKVLEAMGQMGQLSGDAAKAMLRAGGNVLQREWIREAERRRHVRTSSMIDSVNQTSPRQKDNALQVEVYPQGKDKTGTRNSVKAFVLHHGRDGSRPIKADHWVDNVVKNATDESNTAMATVWGQFITTGKVPVVKKLKKGQK